MQTEFRQLLLCPADPRWVSASQAALGHTLKKLALIGSSIGDPAAARYLIGETFLTSFSFMGCAPNIKFEPESREPVDWQAFVFIHTPPAFSQPVWLADSGARPACPACAQRMRDWVAQFHAADMRITCPRCAQATPACNWKWFDAGACARQYISVVNVYPREVLPTDAVLKELETETGTTWQYFYLHAPLLGQD